MQKDPLIGTQLGAYFIQAKLGEGGMAQVYKAYHARLRREVAIKVILPQIADQSGFRERFEREAQLVASLEHRNIVAVYDFGEIGNLTYLVMQYVGGGTLRDLLRRDGRIEIHRAVQYAIQMARALHHAHQRGIVHRDVKPQNMLISASDPDQLLLSDFGIAKLFATSSSQETMLTPSAGATRNDPSLTNADQLVGTAEYMSPEQINRQPVDARSDVYALGIVLFQMLTGEIPFSSTTIQGLLFQHVYTPPKSVREVNPDVPVVLEQIIARALAKAPEHRYQSAEAMALALETISTPSTHPLPADNYPTFGRSSSEPTTYPTPKGPLPPYHGQQSAPGGVSTGQPFTPTTSANLGGIVVPVPAKRKFRLSYVLYVLIIASTLALLFSRSISPALCGIGLFCSTSQQTPSTSSGLATSFNEVFHNNDRSWTTGSQDNGNFTADLSNNQYTLTIGNALNTYFPNPSAVGTLPANFTLTAQITHNRGGSNIFYGLAFHLRVDGSKVYCYAFVVTDRGGYQVLKYNADISPPFSPLWSATSFPAIHDGQSNTLQATVHGSDFSFKINGTPVPVGSNQKTTISDTAYSGGNLALLVAGSNTSFTVTSVALTTQ